MKKKTVIGLAVVAAVAALVTLAVKNVCEEDLYEFSFPGDDCEEDAEGE